MPRKPSRSSFGNLPHPASDSDACTTAPSVLSAQEQLAEALARANEAAAPGKAPGKVLVDAWAKARAVMEGWQFDDIGAAELARLAREDV